MVKEARGHKFEKEKGGRVDMCEGLEKGKEMGKLHDYTLISCNNVNKSPL